MMAWLNWFASMAYVGAGWYAYDLLKGEDDSLAFWVVCVIFWPAFVTFWLIHQKLKNWRRGEEQ